MPRRVLLRDQVAQPRGAQQIAAAWERDVVFAAIPGAPEIVTGTTPKPIGAGSVRGVTRGLAFTSDNTSTQGWSWPLPATSPLYSITDEFTVIVLADIRGTAAYSNVFGVPYGSGWTPPYYALGMIASGDATTHFLSFATPGTQNTATGAAGALTGPALYGVARKGTAVRFFKNRAITNATASGTGAIDWGSKQPATLFNRSSTSVSEGSTAYGFLAVVLRRAVSDEEWLRIVANPWQFIQESRIVMPFGGAAGGGVDLVIQASAHSQLADALDLSASSTLVTQDATHSQLADALTLSTTTGAVLVIDAAGHAQLADAPTLITQSALQVADAIHAQAADALALSTTDSVTLTINAAAHAQLAGSPTVTMDQWLQIAAAFHAQLSDKVDLTGGVVVAADGITIVLRRRRR